MLQHSPSNPDPSSTSLADLPQFDHDHAGVVLYGVDDTTGIVAVEMLGNDRMTVFHRTRQGTTESTIEPFTPWLVTADPRPWQQSPSVTQIRELRGPHPVRFVVEFANWDEYRRLTAGLRGNDAQRDDIYMNGSPVSQFLMQTGKTLFTGMTFDDVRRMQLDIETLGLDPNEPEAEVIMIAIRQGDVERVLVQQESEAELLDALNDVFAELDPDIIEGHNIYSFDLPYLATRAQRHRVRLSLGRDGSPPQIWENQQRFRAGPVSLPYTAVHIHGRHVVDTLQQIQRHDVQGVLTGYGLKNVIRELGIEREDREFVAGDEIANLWRAGERDRERLARYALDDVRDTDLLARITTPTEFYQTQILPLTYQRATVSGTGKKIDDLMIRAYLSASHSLPLPNPPRDYPGGYTSVLHSGVFGPIVKADVESLYPSIMISRNIGAASDVLGAFPILLRDLTQRRLDAKQRVRETEGEERARYDALQGSFKILINSFYGYLGFGIGRFNDYDAAEAVTLEGQRIIKAVVAQLEATGATPIEVDTDGVYFTPPENVRDELAEEAYVEHIGQSLGAGIRLAHDGRYRNMLSLKMKTYGLLGYDGSLLLKGSALRSRRMEGCFQEFLRTAALHLMLGERDKAREAYFQLAERIQKKELRPEEIGQWAMLKRSTAEKQPRLNRLLRSTQGQWKFGERVVIYERDNGELGLIQNYSHDENTVVLLRRLKETATRFREIFPSDAEFEAFFPTIQQTTHLDQARKRQPVEQLGLF